MKKAVKTLLLLIFSVAICFTCSCHGKLKENEIPGNSDENISQIVYKNDFKIPDSFDYSKNYELTFWAKNDTNVVQKSIYEKAIADFCELYPNIHITMRLYTDYSRIYNDVITNISTNTTPNICITYPDHIATYLSGENTVVKLNDLFEDEKFGLGGTEIRFDAPTKAEIVPEFLDECALQGDYFGVPFMRSGEACYINTTLLENLGYELPDALTWDYIWEVSEAAMKKDSNGNYVVNGQNVLIPFIYKSTDNMMIQMLRQSGAPYSSENGEIFIFNNKTTEILNTIAEHAKSRAFSTFKISSYPGNYLNANQCIFAIDSTAGATWIGADAPLSDLHKKDMAEFETEVMMIPQFDTDNQKMISQGPSVCVFYKEDPNEVIASWMFVQYLLTNDIQIAYSQTEGYVPVTLKAQNSNEYTDYLSRAGEDNDKYYDVKIKASKLVLENIDNTFITPVFNGSASLRSAAGQMIENVTKSVRRNEEINDEYFDKMYSEVISLYRLTNISEEQPLTFASVPVASKVFLACLCLVWLGIIGYSISVYITKKKKKQ